VIKGSAATPIWRRGAYAALGAGMAFEFVWALTGVGGSSLANVANDWIYQAIEFVALAICLARVVQRREQRLAWALMTAALACWSLGDLTWSVWLDHVANPPAPSIADLAYLLMYPAIYGSLMALLRSRIRGIVAAQWLDGGVVALAVGSVAAALVLSDILRTTTGRFAADAVNLAYPVGDGILLMFVAMAYVLTGRRGGRDWMALGAGVTLMAVADILYADQAAGGIYLSSGWDNLLYLSSFCVLAVTAWLPSSAPPTSSGRSRDTVAMTFVAAAIALGLLVVAAFTTVSAWAVGLAAGALALATVRSALTYRENALMLHATSEQAATDALTGLGNRRRLLTELEQAFAEQRHPATLVFFDLNGFKRYNDVYGHGVGDALLARLGSALRACVSGAGSAYRLGGDEFCVLLDGRHTADDELIANARAALNEHGGGFDVTTALGIALIPEEARSPDAALRLADERMYADKARTQRTPVRDVLLQLLAERTPELLDHSSSVTALVMPLAADLGLNGELLDETLRAAELHDIGKLAIPDAIVEKPGPLDDDEWDYMRQHPVIGQRILGAAPSLSGVAAIVRATHERWDGGGYPDGLRGERIPLGARLIAVCDAYHAMVSERLYQRARGHSEALAELQHHAGTQFDAAVVASFVGHFTRDPGRDEVPVASRVTARAQP
jgi:diguanylate cyclase (GGDEF)-like protein